jgi:shikimate dehydrogenase
VKLVDEEQAMLSAQDVMRARAESARAQGAQRLLGLIGAGIQLSLTPSMQVTEALAQGLTVDYQLIDLDRTGEGTEALPGLLHTARELGFAGLNITYPCKQAVMALLDDLSDEARAMGAVNTVVFRDDRAIGHNTDGSGWRWGFERALPGADLTRVVLLGAGGAGSAIAHSVCRMRADMLVVVDSDGERAAALAAALNQQYGGQRVSATTDAAIALHGASGLIHATPTGMAKLPGLPLLAALLRPELWVSEIVYFPLETALLKAAWAIGCRVVDGGTMAVGQAIGAFELFTGLSADAPRMEAHLRQLLSARHI